MTPWPEGYGRRVYDTLDSTLSEAARLQQELTAPTWILALEQTAARGRRGRSWATPRGNFAATLMMPRKEPPGVAALRSFVASLALYRAFVAVTGREDAFALKWPNDVLLRGGKVAGEVGDDALEQRRIGIGVNLAHGPAAGSLEPRALPAVTLREAGGNVRAEEFLDVLAREYAGLEEQFTTYGFSTIRSAWLAHAARLGEVITARTMRDEMTGVFEDVDSAGNLILRTRDGAVPITAADVFF